LRAGGGEDNDGEIVISPSAVELDAARDNAQVELVLFNGIVYVVIVQSSK
jgi:hypothetical protein